ncbi:MAG: heavy metal-binding domain-containing protein, partial [Rhodospirillaceae bacterium]|nr:heavy metal-binding domain-containing protein [Rhodospirillaceae bacterium]
MIITTTNDIQGRSVTAYLGIVSGDAVMGTNIFRDIMASVRDIVGGRSGSYEKILAEAKAFALTDLQ